MATSALSVELCGCGKLPFRHGKLRLEEASYHPIFSKRAAILLAERGIDPERLAEFRSSLASLDLPGTHLFDCTVDHLRREEEAAAEKGSSSACFAMCHCGLRHGFVFGRSGELLFEVENKKQGLDRLDRLTAERKLPLGDLKPIRRQILESPLPSGDPAPDTETESDEGGSKVEARFEMAPCGKHGRLFDAADEEFAQPWSKEEAIEALQIELDFGNIDKQEEARLTGQIMKSSLPDTSDPDRTTWCYCADQEQVPGWDDDEIPF